jgi:carbonic anhydrase/acetyltransferase-like protein (isoleucine patch superfamily)
MTLTYTGNLGIGITNPSTRLEVSGIATISSNLFVGNNLYVSNSSEIDGDLTVSGNTVVEDLTINDTLTVTNFNPTSLNITSGISTFYDINVTNNGLFQSIGIANTLPLDLLHIGDYISDPENSVVISGGGIGIGTTVRRFGLGIDAESVGAIFGAVGVGTTDSQDQRLWVNGNVKIQSGDLKIGSGVTISSSSGIITATNGFTSGIGTAVQITTVGNTLVFTVPGVGSTSFILS